MKKLNLHQAEERLLELNLKVFTPNDLRVIFGVSQRAVQGFLHYNLEKGAFVHLRKGLYTLKRNLPPEFVLANRLYAPSYISLDSALAYYHLIPETIYAVTSVTTKPTRKFVAHNLSYEYRKIKREAYTGYQPKEINGQLVYLATPEKAVADFLYFVSLGKRSFNERLKLGKIDKNKLNKYLKLFKQK
jgi:predicted transcriptional regulator of viral defense system